MNETTPGQSPAKKRDRASKLARRQSLKFKRSKVSAQKKLESASEKRVKRARNADNHKRNAMNLERASKKRQEKMIGEMIKSGAGQAQVKIKKAGGFLKGLLGK